METDFVSYTTYRYTMQAVSDWAAGRYGIPERQHRLLVLASPALAPVLEGITFAGTDRVLMLNAPGGGAVAGGVHVKLNVSSTKITD